MHMSLAKPNKRYELPAKSPINDSRNRLYLRGNTIAAQPNA